ncbi:hypothetical protein GGR51DRAFT_85488 [Nemania sp. FL0031]|nr:hypothetical protein GGR51DRAFT_85488 [Nemania sp. FL0031]
MANTKAITLVTVTARTDYIFTYEHNKKFLFLDEDQDYAADSFTDVPPSLGESAERRTPGRQTRSPPSLRITTCDAHRAKHPQSGFVFGTDAEKCDILLDGDYDSTISRTQFAIKGNWKTGILLIKNLSFQGTDVRCNELGKLNLRSTRILPLSDELQIRVGPLDLKIECPDHRRLMKEDWKIYCNEMNEMQSKDPSLANLNLESAPKTTNTPQEPNYRIGEKIGSGGFGTVFEATNIVDGNMYAAKLAHVDDTFKKEVESLKKISHNHIVKFEHVWRRKKETSPMLIMELVECGDLQTVNKAHPLTSDELREGLRQLFTALAYVHGLGITHRDIKPANILVQSRNPLHLKLTDFGLASISDNLQTRCGTPLYSAPEIFGASNENYCNKVDIWSIGMVALELFHGIPGERYNENRSYEWPATVASYLGALESCPTVRFISSLLQDDPSKRPTAMNTLEHPFFTAPLQSIAALHNRLGIFGRPGGTLDEQYHQDSSPLYNDTVKITAVHDGQENTLTWTTQIHVSSPNHPTRHSRNEATSDSSSGDQDSTVLFKHPDFFRNPFDVGSEVEKILAQDTTANTAEATTTGRTNPSVKEHEQSQLPNYDLTAIPRTSQRLTTQAPSLAQPANANGLGNDGDVVPNDQNDYYAGLSDNRIFCLQAATEANASQSPGYNAGDRTISHLGVGPHINHSPHWHFEPASSISTNCLQEFYNDPSKGCGIIDNEPRDSITCRGNDIQVEAHPSEASQHLDTRLTIHNLGDISYILIQRQPVSIRISDNYLNAKELFEAAGLDDRGRRHYMRPLKARDAVSVDNGVELLSPFRKTSLPIWKGAFTTKPIPTKHAEQQQAR